MTREEIEKKIADMEAGITELKEELKKAETELSKKEKLLKQIEFEEKWLLDVYAKDRKVSFKDIDIAIGAIEKAVKEMD